MSRTFDIVQSMSGQKNVIVLPRPYLQFFKEDQQAHALAAVLNNLVFWSAFGSEDGWFYKTHRELGFEAGELTEDQTERLVKKLITKYLPGVFETCSKKINGTPTKHYRMDGDLLISFIFPEKSESVKTRNGKREGAGTIPRNCVKETAINGNPGNRESAESYLYTDFKTDLDIQTNKPSCPVAPQPDPEVLITDNAILVLTHLNQVSGSRYKKSKTSLENIRGRLRDGYSVDDLKLVIDLKHEHWSGNDDQYQYMRPETLFGPKKFESYLQSASRWDSKGRPKRQDWEGQRKATDLMSFGAPDKAIPAGFRGAKP